MFYLTSTKSETFIHCSRAHCHIFFKVFFLWLLLLHFIVLTFRLKHFKDLSPDGLDITPIFTECFHKENKEKGVST